MNNTSTNNPKKLTDFPKCTTKCRDCKYKYTCPYVCPYLKKQLSH